MIRIPPSLLSPLPRLHPHKLVDDGLSMDPGSADGVAEYHLYVGTSQAALESAPWKRHLMAIRSQGTSTSASGLRHLPLTGKPVFVRLWYRVAGSGNPWFFIDYTYQTSGGDGGGSIPAMTTPPPANPLTNSSVTFDWTPGVGWGEFELAVGTSQAALESAPWGDIFWQKTGANTSQVVSDIPLTGNPVYVRLWYRVAGSGNPWFFVDYTYQTSGGDGGGSIPAMTTPPPANPLTNSSVTFDWTPGVGWGEFELAVATSQAALESAPWGDIFWQKTGANTSQVVSDIPLTGNPVFVRLWYRVAGSGNPWFFVDYTYQTHDIPVMTTPLPANPLTSSSVTFDWTPGVGWGEYELAVATSQAALESAPWGDIFWQNTGANTSQAVSSIPLTGKPVFLRLWYRVAGSGNPWFFVDYTYQTHDIPVMTTPLPANPLTSSSVTFDWTPGEGWGEYWLGVGTSQAAVANSPWGDTFAGSTGANTSQAVSGIPITGNMVFVRLWYRVAGSGNPWFFVDYTYQTQWNGNTPALVKPSQGSTLRRSTMTFQWSGDSGVDEYWLEVGTTPGGDDIYTQSAGTSRSASVSGIPLNGNPAYARLWWHIGSTWAYADYKYQTRKSRRR